MVSFVRENGIGPARLGAAVAQAAWLRNRQELLIEKVTFV
jgi:hypothetical protein